MTSDTTVSGFKSLYAVDTVFATETKAKRLAFTHAARDPRIITPHVGLLELARKLRRYTAIKAKRPETAKHKESTIQGKKNQQYAYTSVDMRKGD